MIQDTRYSPISSGARASAKGLPRRLGNTIEQNIERFRGSLHLTNSRAKNYKLVTSGLLKLYRGVTLVSEEEGRGKQKAFSVVVMLPVDSHDGYELCLYRVPFKNPVEWDEYDLNINITRHALERIYQRFAGYDDSAALKEITGLMHLGELLGKDGKFELGTGNGMAIIEKTDEPRIEAITWIDEAKLRPEQPVKAGDARHID